MFPLMNTSLYKACCHLIQKLSVVSAPWTVQLTEDKMRRSSPDASLVRTIAQFPPLELETWSHFPSSHLTTLMIFTKLRIMKSNCAVIETSLTLVCVSLDS